MPIKRNAPLPRSSIRLRFNSNGGVSMILWVATGRRGNGSELGAVLTDRLVLRPEPYLPFDALNGYPIPALSLSADHLSGTCIPPDGSSTDPPPLNLFSREPKSRLWQDTSSRIPCWAGLLFSPLMQHSGGSLCESQTLSKG